MSRRRPYMLTDREAAAAQAALAKQLEDIRLPIHQQKATTMQRAWKSLGTPDPENLIRNLGTSWRILKDLRFLMLTRGIPMAGLERIVDRIAKLQARLKMTDLDGTWRWT